MRIYVSYYPGDKIISIFIKLFPPKFWLYYLVHISLSARPFLALRVQSPAFLLLSAAISCTLSAAFSYSVFLSVWSFLAASSVFALIGLQLRKVGVAVSLHLRRS